MDYNFHRSLVSGASFDERHEGNPEMKKVHSLLKSKHRSIAKHHAKSKAIGRLKKHELMKGVGTARGIHAAMSSFRKNPTMLGTIGENHHVDTVGMKAKHEGDRAYKRHLKFSSK